MRSRYFVLLACAVCTAGAISCSDDGSEQMDTLPLQGGSGGSSNGGSSNGGSSNGGSSTGGSSQQPAQGGSSNPGGGGTAQGGASGSGTGGMTAQGGTGGSGMGGMMAQGGTGGGDGEPDAGGPDPNEDAVLFSDVFPILVANCGGCHGNPTGLPGFAQANNEDASYAETQQNGTGGQLIAQRIITRAVTQRSMPPQCDEGQLGQGACLDVDEAADLQAWLADGALP
jgi:hypothetical protein